MGVPGELEACVRDLLARDTSPICIDARSLDFIDCAGLGGLERGVAIAESAGVAVEVLRDTGPAHHLTEITRGAKRFPRTDG